MENKNRNLEAKMLFSLLVVEDHPLMQIVYKHQFSLYPVELTFVQDGVSALNLIQVEKRKFELVLLDIGLPDMNGLNLALKLRDSGLSCPIIVVSAQWFSRDELSSTKEFIQSYYLKPLTTKDIKEIMTLYLSANYEFGKTG